jgi:hypothetical protein
MSNDKESKSKVTYSSGQVYILLLKEAFLRDLNLFKTLLEKAPQAWTYTVIENGGRKELIVNVPPQKK